MTTDELVDLVISLMDDGASLAAAILAAVEIDEANPEQLGGTCNCP